MPTGQLDGVVRQLRRAALLGHGAELADAELLERFITHRDQEAFELLVRRHGPMVLGVCKRVLRNDTDADDAFQATFVVFVRKASSILPRAKVGNWLYGVAHKTALKAKAMNTRRRVKEREAGAVSPAPTRDDTWASLLDILDDELSVLPEKYRTAIVLCDLEGRSYREAAAQLGCPQGTLSGRLTRARALLARRLAGHGLTASAGAVAALLARHASAAVSPSLLTFALRAGTMLATGSGLTAGAVSAKVASLAEGVIKMMLLTKLKIATGVLLFVAATVVAGWMYAAEVSAQAITPGDNAVPLTDNDTRTPVPKKGAAISQTDSREAEFVFRSEDRGRKTVALVVAGTSAPVLNLPVRDDLRILVEGRRVGIDRLRSGARVSIRMDPTNRAIQEIRALAGGPRTVVLAAKDLEYRQSPSTEEALRFLPKVPRPAPGIYEVTRSDIKVVTELLVDKLDSSRFYPLLGPAQLHHRHWKCTVHYTETVESSYPYPFRFSRPRVAVVYIDKDYLIQSK